MLCRRNRSQHCPCAQQIVPAPMARAAGDQGLWISASGDLAQPGQGIELSQESDHRAAVPPLRDKGCRNAGQVSLDSETCRLQLLDLAVGRPRLPESKFGEVPYTIGDFSECAGFRVDARDQTAQSAAIQGHLRISWGRLIDVRGPATGAPDYLRVREATAGTWLVLP